MRARIAPSVVFTAFVGCGPSAPPPEPPRAPPPKAVATAPAKPPTGRAIWNFPSVAGLARAQLDLGDKGILKVGQRGRRWLLPKGSGEAKQAPTLAPRDLDDARIDGSKILLLGENGEVYTSSDPLGPIESTTPAPKDHKAFEFRAGKQALLGLERDGTILRSTDAGATWTTSELPMRPGDMTIALAANRRGEAMVLIHPQRVFLSTDDGATWSPIQTPGIGARDLQRDGNDDLFLRGAHNKFAKLSSGKLDAKDAKPTPLAEHMSKDAFDRRVRTNRVLAGNRVVTLIETEAPNLKSKKLEIAIAPLGAESPAPTVLEPSMPSWGARVMVGGYDSTVVLALHDEKSDPPSTKLIRTNDDGKTWEQIAILSGRVGYLPTGSSWLHVGPNWLVVGERCDEQTKVCKAASAKVGASEWKDLPLQPKSTLSAVEFDPAHDRVWILGLAGDVPVLVTSKLKDATFTVASVDLPAKSKPRAATVDAKGSLKLVYPEPSRIIRVAPDLGVQPPLYLPFDADRIDLAGDRGLAYDNYDAYETADGGEKWLRVSGAALGRVGCNAVGCVHDEALRVGWDLPNDAATLLASTTTAKPPKNDKPVTGAAPVVAPTPLKVSCTPGGTWKPYDGMLGNGGYALGLDGDVRFANPSYTDDGSIWLSVARGGAAPTTIKLLGAAPKRKPTDTIVDRQWRQQTSGGVVAVRYSFDTTPAAQGDAKSKYNPVDVELAWYAAATGKTGRAKLEKVSPFRVGQATQSAMHAIVDGGLLFLPKTGDAPLYFVRENGKVEKMPRPPTEEGFTYSDAVKIGNKIILADLEDGDPGFVSTNDSGKSWSTMTSWSLGTDAWLSLVDGRPALLLGSPYDANGPKGLIAFDAITNDPPPSQAIAPSKLDVGASGLTACTPKARAGARVVLYDSQARRSIEMAIEPAKNEKDNALAMSMRMFVQVDRIDAAGNACVEAILSTATSGGYLFNGVLSPHDPGNAWLLRPIKGAKFEARPMTCKVN